MPDNISDRSLYVVLLDLLKHRTSMGNVLLSGNAQYVTVIEILDFFNITLDPGIKVFIKRQDQSDCRKKDYETNATLPREHFNNCVMVLAHYRPGNEIFQSFHRVFAEKKFEDELSAQNALWREKKLKKEKHGGKIPQRLVLRNKLVKELRKKKIRARSENIESEKKDKENPA
jgi:hypothetical protein